MRLTRSDVCRLTILGVLLSVLTACGGDESAENETAAARSGAAAMPRNQAAPGAAVFIITPQDGATVTSPVTVKFGVSGIAIQPAGTRVENSGHHHLLIDTALANPDLPIPSDAQHLHFGKGQTEASVELDAGEHTLQLVLGDVNHVPHQPPVMSAPVKITVVAE